MMEKKKGRLHAIWAEVVIAEIRNNQSAESETPLIDHIDKLKLPG